MFTTFNHYTIIVVIAISWLAICNGNQLLNSNEKEAQQFALEISDKLFQYYDRSRDIANNDPNFKNKHAIIDDSMFLMEIVRQAKSFDFKNFKDNELKYAFEQIDTLDDEMIIGGEKYLKIVILITDLSKLDTDKIYNCFKGCHSNSGKMNTLNITEVQATTNNVEELEFYWKQLRETRAKLANEYLNLALTLLKESGNLTDKTPLEFYLREYNLTEIENLMREIQPLYMELHAFIRKGLQNKYGDSIISSDGLIPHHLFEQVMLQAWTNGSIIEELFPFENLPPVESIMEKRFKSIELYEIADRFYQSLGFEKFSYQVWKDQFKMIKSNNNDSNECFPETYIESPDVRLEFCEKMSFPDFLKAYEIMGSIYYAKEMTGLPSYFFFTNDLEYTVGKAAMLSATTLHNLKTIGMIIDFEITEQVEINRLFRKSIESLLKLPLDFVHIELMKDLLSGNLELKELNNKYWELMEKYAGVKPPMNYVPSPDVPDMPFEFYYQLYDNEQSRDFDSDIMSYQMYKKLCELSGKYPKEPLHLCDIHGTKAAGDLLKNMMRLGSSKPFNVVLATMFPEKPKASTEGILKYYSPVQRILVEKNSEAKVKPGWKNTP